MDVHYFLSQRLKFIEQFYEGASARFRDTIRKIEEELPPFDDPPYSEDPEPAFLEEWIEANTSLMVVGQNCISMLSESLKLYFKTWEGEIGAKWVKQEEKDAAFAKGFIGGYKAYFAAVLETSWEACPANFGILEQVTLARNRAEHPDHITTILNRHSENDRARYPNLFFVSETERKAYSDVDMASSSWITPTLEVSADSLAIAIREVEKLAAWLEPKIFECLYPRQKKAGSEE
jgi:hypothetical protein